MNGPWSSEVSSVDPGVSQTQWWQSFYRKNKNTDPQAHGPCCGRGLDMVGHFKGKKERKNEEVLHLRGCFGSEVQASVSQVQPDVSRIQLTGRIPNDKHHLFRVRVVLLWLFQSQTWRARLPGRSFAPALPADLWSAFVLRAPSLMGGGGGLRKQSRGLLSDPMGRREVHTHTQPPKVSAHPPPSSLPYARGTGPIFGFVWGVGGHDWALPLPQRAHRSGEQQIYWDY